MQRVVVIDTGYESYAYERTLLEEAGYTLDVYEGNKEDRAQKLAWAEGAIGLFVRWTVVDGEFLDALPSLEAIVRYGVGYDNIDVQAATQRGVHVANVQGYASHSVSDHALALMYACARALPLAPQGLYDSFTQPPRTPMFEFRDRTLGIIGLGDIGGTLCRKAAPLFHRVVATDPYVPDHRFEELGARKVDLDSLLEESHVISIHCNLTEETTHLIDRDAFDRMRKTPILVNTARGEVVDEEALLDALHAGGVHSAGLDVYSEEPPGEPHEGLLNHPHVIATGHYAWYSESATSELQERAAHNMLALLQGTIPEDCLNAR